MLLIDILKKFDVHSFLLITLLVVVKEFCTPDEMSDQVAVEFEVFGRVQGVSFRKFTRDKATKLGLRGWCMNTRQFTVIGYMEGKKAKVDEMKTWLQNTGSPQSTIDTTEFRNERHIDGPTLNKFTIKK